jgi:TolB protein
MNPDGSDQHSLGAAGFVLYQQALDLEALSNTRQEIIQVRGIDQTELWRYNLINGNELRVTNNPANDYDPVWSPISNDLLFVSERSGRTDIYRLNLDLPGDAGERLTLTGDFDKHPSWSPDATRIVYWSGNDQHRQIWVLDPVSKQTFNISNNPFNDWDPIWIK